MQDLKRGVFKLISDIMIGLDVANNITEIIYSKEEIIKAEDKVKDAVEDLTGIHIERENERIQRLSKFLNNYTPEERVAREEYFRKNAEVEILKREKEEHEEKIENLKALFIVIGTFASIPLFVVLFIWFMNNF